MPISPHTPLQTPIHRFKTHPTLLKTSVVKTQIYQKVKKAKQNKYWLYSNIFLQMQGVRLEIQKKSIEHRSYIIRYDPDSHLPRGHSTYNFKFEHLNNLL
jgi:hypothetical protein